MNRDWCLCCAARSHEWEREGWRREKDKGRQNSDIWEWSVRMTDDDDRLCCFNIPPRWHACRHATLYAWSSHTPTSPPQHLAPAPFWKIFLFELNNWQGVSRCDSHRRAKKKGKRKGINSRTYDNIYFVCNLLWQWSTAVLRDSFKKKIC